MLEAPNWTHSTHGVCHREHASGVRQSEILLGGLAIYLQLYIKDFVRVGHDQHLVKTRCGDIVGLSETLQHLIATQDSAKLLRFFALMTDVLFYLIHFPDPNLMILFMYLIMPLCQESLPHLKSFRPP